jgi:hypothetical protein
MDARDWTTEFLRSDPWCNSTEVTLSLFSYISYPLYPPSSYSSFLSIVLFLVFKNNIIFENEKHFQNNKKANQKYMNRALDHSKHMLHLNHSDIAPSVASLRRSFYLYLVANNRQLDKMNKKLKKKIAFSRVEPGSSLFCEQTRTTTTRRLAWKEAWRFDYYAYCRALH